RRRPLGFYGRHVESLRSGQSDSRRTDRHARRKSSCAACNREWREVAHECAARKSRLGTVERLRHRLVSPARFEGCRSCVHFSNSGSAGESRWLGQYRTCPRSGGKSRRRTASTGSSVESFTESRASAFFLRAAAQRGRSL